MTSDPDRLPTLLRESVREGVAGVVVVGGDGMVNLGLAAVACSEVPLGIVPAGTGNDVARSLGLPVDDVAAACSIVLEGLSGTAARAIDAVRCSWPGTEHEVFPDRWFGGVLGAGFDAVVNERANGWSRPRGRSRYVAAMLRELPAFRPRTYRIDLDGVEWTTPATLIAVANGPSYGGGMRVCPDARLDDGLLDVMVVGPSSRVEFLRIFPRVYAGTHVRHPAVTIRRARTVDLSSPGIVAYGDGERFGPLPLTCTIVPGALRVLVPAL